MGDCSKKKLADIFGGHGEYFTETHPKNVGAASPKITFGCFEIKKLKWELNNF